MEQGREIFQTLGTLRDYIEKQGKMKIKITGFGCVCSLGTI